MTSRILAAVLFFAAFPLRLPAQEGSVSLKIDVVAWGDAIGGLSFKSGGKEGNITARPFNYSEPVSYSGPQLLEIHQSGSGGVPLEQVPGTPEDKDHEVSPLIVEKPKPGQASPQSALAKELAQRREEEPTLVSLVQLPSNSRRVTVLLAPLGDGTFQGYVIDDDPSRLPLGKLRVHNLAPMPISMKFSGGQTKEMKPRETFLVTAAKGQTIYELSYLEGEEWKVQENNIIPVREDEQTQMIVLRSTNQFFLSSDGATAGFLQVVTLRRQKVVEVP